MQPGRQYAKAGVDIQLADTLKGGLQKHLRSASRPEVLSEIGAFGGLFDLSGGKYKEPVLVSSVDGVGTKLKLAFGTGLHEVVGEDIVNHCVNDIAVLGAEPLFFLDYIGMGKLAPGTFQMVIAGMAKACRKANCALIGGETAQMPGFYREGEYDLVGSVVGIVEKKRILTGQSIRPGDKVIGLASNGLHTNGYSLATKILFTKLRYRMDDPLPGGKSNIGEALLKPHTNYARALHAILAEMNKGKSSSVRKENTIFGAAHITGGGFTGNIPRILPETCDVTIQTSAWPKPPIFQILAEQGGITFDELYEVFNMGIGMTLFVDAQAADQVVQAFRKARLKAYVIGEVTKGSRQVHLD
jgi:phosphoribosylformylglycinamidine cyclo-ligase